MANSPSATSVDKFAADGGVTTNVIAVSLPDLELCLAPRPTRPMSCVTSVFRGSRMSKTIDVELDEIQGNSLGGFNKDYQANLFLRFRDAGRDWVAEITNEIWDSSSADVIQFNNQFSALRRQGVKNPESIISAVWVNLAFSWQGLKALGIPDAELQNFPDDFKTGMKGRAGIIGDVGNSAPNNWLDPFKDPANIHALLIVAADHSQELAQKVHDVTRTAKFNAGVEVVFSQPGITRLDQPGHEHFGFKDGISQPGVRGVDPPDDPIGNPNQGHPGQDLLWPGEFVLGYATQISDTDPNFDGPNPEPGDDSKSGPDWTKNGSYLVFRRLRQDVPAFNQMTSELASKLKISTDLIGAKLVGRYKSGAPIEQRKFQPGPYTPPSVDPGDPNAGNPAFGNDSSLNNNFEFGDDADGHFCPVSAHIRKAYPRDEVTPDGAPHSESSTQTHRILRRGIPYGAPFVPHDPDSAKVDRGLLFLCYQNSIERHFEYIQRNWVNATTFPPDDKKAQGAPNLLADPGPDPIIAQVPEGETLIDPKAPPIKVQHFVQTTGGEYFFSPSISALNRIGANQPL